jgi:ankyrin repeat protein
MVERGANLAATYGVGQNSLLHLAAFFNNKAMVQFMLEHGLTANHGNKDGILPYLLSNVPEIRHKLQPSLEPTMSAENLIQALRSSIRESVAKLKSIDGTKEE